MKRALRDVPPDSYHKDQPRWRLPRIVAALEANVAPSQKYVRNNHTELGDQIAEAWREFDVAFDEMKNAPTLAKRRALAVKMAPMFANIDALLREIGIANDEDEFLWSCGCDKLRFITLRVFEYPCEWTHDQAFEHLILGASD